MRDAGSLTMCGTSRGLRRSRRPRAGTGRAARERYVLATATSCDLDRPRRHPPAAHLFQQTGATVIRPRLMGDVLVVADIVLEVALRPAIHAGTTTDKVGNGLGLNLGRLVRQALAVRPPCLVGRAEVAAVEVGQFVDQRCESGSTDAELSITMS